MPSGAAAAIIEIMHREFRDVVETLALDAQPAGVTFADSRGHYSIEAEPRDVLEVLKTSLHSGRAVRVTCDATTLTIVDAVLD